MKQACQKYFQAWLLIVTQLAASQSEARFDIVTNMDYNSLKPSDSIWRDGSESLLDQVMACHLLGTNPLPARLMIYCQVDPWKQTSVKYQSKHIQFQSIKSLENVVCKMLAILFWHQCLNCAMTRWLCWWRNINLHISSYLLAVKSLICSSVNKLYFVPSSWRR